MTAVEQATLERLEDQLTKRLDHVITKLDGIDERVRKVEIAQAMFKGAEDERYMGGGRRIQLAQFSLASAVSLVAIPGSIWAVLNIAKVLTG